MEEAAEVQQIIGKILRHGYSSFHPNDETKTTNRELLEKEIGDLFAAIDLATVNKDIRMDIVIDAAKNKMNRVGKYLHYSHCGVESK